MGDHALCSFCGLQVKLAAVRSPASEAMCLCDVCIVACVDALSQQLMVPVEAVVETLRFRQAYLRMSEAQSSSGVQLELNVNEG